MITTFLLFIALFIMMTAFVFAVFFITYPVLRFVVRCCLFVFEIIINIAENCFDID